MSAAAKKGQGRTSNSARLSLDDRRKLLKELGAEVYDLAVGARSTYDREQDAERLIHTLLRRIERCGEAIATLSSNVGEGIGPLDHEWAAEVVPDYELVIAKGA